MSLSRKAKASCDDGIRICRESVVVSFGAWSARVNQGGEGEDELAAKRPKAEASNGAAFQGAAPECFDAVQTAAVFDLFTELSSRCQGMPWDAKSLLLFQVRGAPLDAPQRLQRCIDFIPCATLHVLDLENCALGASGFLQLSRMICGEDSPFLALSKLLVASNKISTSAFQQFAGSLVGSAFASRASHLGFSNNPIGASEAVDGELGPLLEALAQHCSALTMLHLNHVAFGFQHFAALSRGFAKQTCAEHEVMQRRVLRVLGKQNELGGSATEDAKLAELDRYCGNARIVFELIAPTKHSKSHVISVKP